MRRMKLPLGVAIAVMAVWLMPTALMAQDVKIGVVDMEKAMVQTIDGKKAEAKFTARFDEMRKGIETKQQQIADTQKKLQTQDRLLADTVKATMAKDVERWQTELTRQQEDSQKELDSMRGDLMAPIAKVAEGVVSAYATEMGYTLIIDVSNPQNESVVYVNPNADITNEITRRIDAAIAQAAKKPAPNR
jgi:outer membrane protein